MCRFYGLICIFKLMKKFFEDVEVENTDVIIQQPKVEFQKAGLLRSVGDFSIEVLDAIEKWLFSFPTGMTKDAFQRQIAHLEKDSKIALAQLKAAHGFRVIRKYKEEFPKLDKSFIECIAEGRLFVTIDGDRKVCEKYVLKALRDLKEYGSVYVLDCAILFAELKSSRERGCTDDMLEKAKKCDFLILENLAQSIGYVCNVACWSLTAVVNARAESNKPILARYNEYKNLKPIYEKCPVYSLEG